MMSSFEHRREILGRQLEQGALTAREHRRELAQLERDDRRARLAAAARRAAAVAKTKEQAP